MKLDYELYKELYLFFSAEKDGSLALLDLKLLDESDLTNDVDFLVCITKEHEIQNYILSKGYKIQRGFNSYTNRNDILGDVFFKKEGFISIHVCFVRADFRKETGVPSANQILKFKISRASKSDCLQIIEVCKKIIDRKDEVLNNAL